MAQEYTSLYPEWLDALLQELKEADRQCKIALKKTLEDSRFVHEYIEACDKYEEIRRQIMQRL